MSSLPQSADFLQPSPGQKRQLLYATFVSVAGLIALLALGGHALFSKAYLPHAYCYLRQPTLVWTHATADLLIGFSYLSISGTLVYLVSKGRRDIPFRWIFLSFGVFIVACGATHFVEVTTIWIPVYVFSAAVKTFTAVASVSTAVAIPFAVPQILELVREAKTSGQRRRQLEFAVLERDAAQTALENSNQRLERKVAERTSQLETANSNLQAEVAERNRTQSRLLELAAIVESSDDAIFSKDLQGTITSWNAGARQLYGYTAEEAIGQPVTLLVPPDLRTEWTSIMARLENGAGIQHFETTRVGKGGHVVAVSLTISPIRDALGRIVGASTIGRDISASKRAEEALRESEEQYRLLFDCNPLPMWVFDRKSLAFLAVNEAAVRHYEFSCQEFLNMTILDIRPAEDVAAVLHELAKPVYGIQEPKVQRHRKKDGTTIDVEITAHAVDFHGVEGELILAHDITARRRGEEQLQESEERFSKAFRASPFGIAISTEAEGRYVDANPAFLRMMGYEWGDLVGHTASELQVWKDPAERSQWLLQMKDSSGPRLLEVRFQTRNGETRFVEVAAERIRLHDEPCILAIMQDVTQRRQLEEQFRQAQKMEAVGLLAGGIAHDFNNMLGVIIGYSDLARDLVDPDHPVRRHLGEIKKAGDRAATLTRQLLAFSRQQVLQPMTLNLNSVVHNLSKMLLRIIGENIQLVLKPEEPLGSVYADLGQLEQVLMNLVVNARDAMPKGGKIIIETANVDLDEVYARRHGPVLPGPYVMLSVSDSGFGMDDATMARIFEPFFTTKTSTGGTGLGLSTVYGIVKQSDGYLRVYSEPGIGTTFKAYLPRVNRPADPLVVAKTQSSYPTGTETILVAEDDASLRKLAVALLEESGYKVLEAENVAMAKDLALHYEGEIDLFLSDVIMPDMSGPELASQLKKDRPELKLLYMSGYTGDLIAGQEMLDPKVALLAKPFSKFSFLTKVREVLDTQTG